MRSAEKTANDFDQAAEKVVELGNQLLDDQEQHGFYRQWTPSGFGPGKHFGYAVQWFAMGAVLAGLLLWNYRKKRF